MELMEWTVKIKWIVGSKENKTRLLTIRGPYIYTDEKFCKQCGKVIKPGKPTFKAAFWDGENYRDFNLKYYNSGCCSVSHSKLLNSK
jgi:hypothetical protein